MKLSRRLLCSLLICGFFLGGLAWSQISIGPGNASYVPPNGFVPDSRTAIAIAEAILEPIYGADTIRRERPLQARLKGVVWTVTGSIPDGMVGGVALIQISKADGRILRVTHGR